MEPVLQLANQYRGELADDCEIIRMRTGLLRAEIAAQAERYKRKLSLLEPRMKQNKAKFLDTFIDFKPVDYESGKLLKTFTWTALLLVAASLSARFGQLISPVIGLTLRGSTAFMVAYVVMPALTAHYISRPLDQVTWNDLLLRHVLLGFAICEGLLTGYLFSNRVLRGSPPIAALTPLAIGISAESCKRIIEKDRIKLLGFALGSGFAFHLMLSIFLGFTFSYILLATIYTAIGFVALQIFLKNVTEDTVFTHNYQLGMVYSVLITQMLIYAIFGGKPEDMEK